MGTVKASRREKEQDLAEELHGWTPSSSYGLNVEPLYLHGFLDKTAQMTKVRMALGSLAGRNGSSIVAENADNVWTSRRRLRGRKNRKI